MINYFVHLFKIGGGECYLSKFNNYNFIFNETLFINSNYKTDTLFNYNLDIIYYNTEQIYVIIILLIYLYFILHFITNYILS
jgi:hypothetical protein